MDLKTTIVQRCPDYRKDKKWWLDYLTDYIDNTLHPEVIICEDIDDYFKPKNCQLCQAFNPNVSIDRGPCPGCLFNSGNTTPGCIAYFPAYAETVSLWKSILVSAGEFEKYNELLTEPIGRWRSDYIAILFLVREMDEKDFDRDYFPEVLAVGKLNLEMREKK